MDFNISPKPFDTRVRDLTSSSTAAFDSSNLFFASNSCVCAHEHVHVFNVCVIAPELGVYVSAGICAYSFVCACACAC